MPGSVLNALQISLIDALDIHLRWVLLERQCIDGDRGLEKIWSVWYGGLLLRL